MKLQVKLIYYSKIFKKQIIHMKQLNKETKDCKMLKLKVVGVHQALL
jgi:hypothetical protein